jgi:hypothetical protein
LKGSEDYCQICCKLYIPESEEIVVDGKNSSSTEVCTLPNGNTSQEDENNLMVRLSMTHHELTQLP